MGCGHIFLPIFSFIVNVVFQIFSIRYTKGRTLLKSIFIGFIFGSLSLLLGEFYYLSQQSVKLIDTICYGISNFIIYFILWNVYFHFVNLGETGRRIRILRELMASKDGLSLDDILSRYNAKEIIARRLIRLTKNGQIILKDNKYYIGKPIMLLITKVIVTMKLLILRKRSEFD